MSTETRPPDRLSSERDVELGSTSTDAFTEGQVEEGGPLAKYTQMGNAADEDKVSTLEKSCCIVTFVVLILLLLIPMVVYGITDLQEETRELNPKDLERWNVTTTPSTPITTKSWQEILQGYDDHSSALLIYRSAPDEH
ncbi:unnamed protein product, partial [Mesorhabditis spiculigera]